MTSLIKDNYEKVLLALLLVLLAITSIISIIEVNAKNVPEIIGGGGVVKVEPVPVHKSISRSFLNNLDDSSIESFVYCRNAKCKYLIHKSLVKCNWCKTTIVAVDIIDNDLNRNRIDDKLELKWGLDLDDPNEILRDQDGDGFSTKEEFERDFSPIVSASHPPLALRAVFEGIRNKFIPFKLNDVVIGQDIRGNRRVYVDGAHFKRGSFYLSVGEETEWLKIVNAGEVEGVKFAELQYFDFKFRITKGEKMQYPDWPKYIIKNCITSSKLLVSMGHSFRLTDRNGESEEYELKNYDEAKKELHILNSELSENFKLNQEEAVKEPLK